MSLTDDNENKPTFWRQEIYPEFQSHMIVVT